MSHLAKSLCGSNERSDEVILLFALKLFQQPPREQLNRWTLMTERIAIMIPLTTACTWFDFQRHVTREESRREDMSRPAVPAWGHVGTGMA
jgi:hypothetical protein